MPVGVGDDAAGAVNRVWRYTSAHVNRTELGSLISQDAGVRGDRPCIAGTGVSVCRTLSLAQVHAARAYYHANRPRSTQTSRRSRGRPRPLNYGIAADWRGHILLTAYSI